MNLTKAALLSVLVAFATIASDAALARGGRVHNHHGGARFGVGVGVGVAVGSLFWPGYYYSRPYYYDPYYSPYYSPYYAPIGVAPSQPQTYIEQGGAVPMPAPAVDPSQQGYWYYCAESRTYYPYVKQCAGPWQRVAPQPPPG